MVKGKEGKREKREGITPLAALVIVMSPFITSQVRRSGQTAK